ncbi:MAG: N-acetylneuraminate synthase family protein [Spirochaetales bacterium]|nr:N-acetylneuraminate synthase family protein [Spirochaetales bacterium]
MKPVNISGRQLGSGQPVFIIAEAGINHNGSLDMALKLVDAAADAGADAVKFQLYKVEEQVSKYAMAAEYQKKNGDYSSVIEMAKLYDLAWEEHAKIYVHCCKKGIQYLASSFDKEAVDFLLELKVGCLKIASGEITNYPLLQYASSVNLPILLSTGMSTIADISGAVEQIANHGNPPLALFHCISSYPTLPENVHMRVLQTLEQVYSVPVGFSDHTIGATAAVVAVALGASMVEKHFTLDKGLSGPDHAMSLTPDELKSYVRAVREAELCLGSPGKFVTPDEYGVQKVARRSLVSRRDIAAGESLDSTNLTCKRPATGIEPSMLDIVTGFKSKVDIPADIPISWEMLK